MINRTVLFGHVVADPELRYTKTGKAICSLRIAYNEASKKDQETLYMNVDVWDKQGETCGKALKKGSGIIVEGRLCVDSYTNKEGQKVSKIFITADRVNFVPRFEKLSSEDKPATSKKEAAPQKQAVAASEGGSDEVGGEDIPF